jgi:hypothetical protein
MRATGPLHPDWGDSSSLDATFELSELPVFDLVFHHKAGGRNSPRSMNADYHEALELLLGRLASLRATILGIVVDSSIAQELDPADRELDLQFPIVMSPATDAHDLRLEITRAQKTVARRPDAKPGGGNDQKRIRITLTFEGPAPSFDHLARTLTSGR